jgi:hypothetical protein
MKTLILFLVILIATFAHADEIQDLKSEKIILFFRMTANQILDDLAQKYGQVNYDNQVISIAQLKEVLTKASITVRYDDLIDNTGSIVDAIGTPGQVILDGRKWIEFTKQMRSAHLLVLHELFRMATINDNDFRHSLDYLPVIQPDKTIVPYCNLRVQETEVKLVSKKFSGEGYGTPPQDKGGFILGGSTAEGEEAQNNAVKNITQKCNNGGYTEGPFDIRGSLEIMNQNNNGMKSITLKAFLSGTCYKKEIQKRNKDDQKKEICQKINLCENTFRETGTSNGDDLSLMDQLNKKWNCQ